MVLVDTSGWISLYRRRNNEVGEKMWRVVARNEAALCGQGAEGGQLRPRRN